MASLLPKYAFLKLATSDDEFSLDNTVNVPNGKRSRLIQVERGSPKFAEVEQLFVEGWRHPQESKARPDVRYIFKVLWPASVLKPYLEYKQRVQEFLKVKDEQAIEKLLFHGTRRACLLGESSTNDFLCGLKDCSLCSILRSSFDISKSIWGRFGRGIYTTSCSSKADDYIVNLSESASSRILVLSRVVVGRPYKQYQNAPQMTALPSGYHSITGEPGASLNYDEMLTYGNDTLCPAYLIVYAREKKTASKSSKKKDEDEDSEWEDVDEDEGSKCGDNEDKECKVSGNEDKGSKDSEDKDEACEDSYGEDEGSEDCDGEDEEITGSESNEDEVADNEGGYESYDDDELDESEVGDDEPRIQAISGEHWL